jgi:hypothetical protein
MNKHVIQLVDDMSLTGVDSVDASEEEDEDDEGISDECDYTPIDEVIHDDEFDPSEDDETVEDAVETHNDKYI